MEEVTDYFQPPRTPEPKRNRRAPFILGPTFKDPLVIQEKQLAEASIYGPPTYYVGLPPASALYWREWNLVVQEFHGSSTTVEAANRIHALLDGPEGKQFMATHLHPDETVARVDKVFLEYIKVYGKNAILETTTLRSEYRVWLARNMPSRTHHNNFYTNAHLWMKNARNIASQYKVNRDEAEWELEIAWDHRFGSDVLSMGSFRFVNELPMYQAQGNYLRLK